MGMKTTIFIYQELRIILLAFIDPYGIVAIFIEDMSLLPLGNQRVMQRVIWFFKAVPLHMRWTLYLLQAGSDH